VVTEASTGPRKRFREMIVSHCGGHDRGLPWLARLLANRPRVPCLRSACRLHPTHLVAWRPLTATADAADSLGRAPRNPSELPEAVAVWAGLASLAVRLSPPGLRQQDASRVFPATRMLWGRVLRGCGDAHTGCCVHVWCLIAWPLGRDWV